MSLVYRSVVIHPWLSFMMMTSKKCTSELLMSDVNVMLLWILFRSHRKESNSSCECGHLIKISLIYLQQTNGGMWCLSRKFLSKVKRIVYL